MELKRSFIHGVMDKDSDERLLPQGRMRDALNIRVSTSEGSDVGAIENCLGNEALTDLNLGDNAVTIGSGKEISLNRVYWLVKSDLGTYFIEHDTVSGITSKILEDTRTGDERVLNLKEEFPVDKIIIIQDTDSGKVFACWTDNNDPVRFLNTERAKSYEVNGFGQEEITLIKKPPFNKPHIELLKDITQELENNIFEKFLNFSYRYKYLDGEYSAFSPFTTAAFIPKPFDYNFDTSSNESMVNDFNEVKITINTGSHLVTDIELLFKESNSNTVWRISPYNKNKEEWGDNEYKAIRFSNNKIHKVLASDEINRLYDAVPDKAATMEYIGGQLMLGNYEENKDLLLKNKEPVHLDFDLEQENIAIDTFFIGSPYTSVKTIRDYEVGIVYKDEYGRMTSVLTDHKATVNIPNTHCNKRNVLYSNIRHKAPEFAKGFQFFIKQSRTLYDTIISTLFYNDGEFRWVQLRPGERSKVKEGDYLIVKQDTVGITSRYVETRIVEIKEQPVDFLEVDDGDSDIPRQLAGTYMKIKPEGFQLNKNHYRQFSDWSRGEDATPFISPDYPSANIIDKPIYYGKGTGNKIVVGGTYTNDDKDIRFLVEIDNVSGVVDTFKWSQDNGTNWTTGIPINPNGMLHDLVYGVQVGFIQQKGNLLGERWVIPARGLKGDGYGSPGLGLGEHLGTRAYTAISGPVNSSFVESSIPGVSVIEHDETIHAGATIIIYYGEWGKKYGNEVTKSFHTAREYANIEEWWINESIADKFDFDFNHYWFRRGYTRWLEGPLTQFVFDPNGTIHLIVRSIGSRSQSGSAYMIMRISVTDTNIPLMFETKSIEENSDIFYEIGKTYKIDADGNHLGADGDVSQNGNTPARIKLDWFNCFGWGNGFESYKIKDLLEGKTLGVGTRAHGVIEDYKKNRRASSITWSGIFERTNNYNGLNKFNASLDNFIDLDIAYGSIQRLHSRETNLIAIQENRVQPLGYMKTEFFDQSGNPTMVKSEQVLNILNAYSGEYGISRNPESFAFNGNRVYFVDPRRGTPLRLSQDGITELSKYGHRAFFKNMFRKFPNAKYYGAFDPYFDEYVLTIHIENESGIFSHSIGFSEDTKGWTSRYSYFSEGMQGLNNHFYSFKNGQLYKHNSKNVPRNNFYGVQHKSMVEVIFNESPSDDKIFKALSFEGNKPWKTILETNLAKSHILENEFEYRESRWFAHTRRNEDSQDRTGMNVIGIGDVVSNDGRKLTFAYLPNYLTTNDQIILIKEGNEVVLGRIQDISGNTITLNHFAQNYPQNIMGGYCFALKDSRLEGGSMRGYYMKVTLENDSTDWVELFSVNSKVAKSYV